MKIAIINGSPKGKSGNTNVVVSAFLQGAQAAGAETMNVFLAEKEIQHCRACHSCWFETPGRCTTNDDMAKVLALLAGVNVIAFASPVYFANISGMLKVFMDRMTVIGSPHNQQADSGGGGAPASAQSATPKLLMIASSGLPGKEEFEVISHWIKQVTLKMRTSLIGEIYVSQGKLLANPPDELHDAAANYLRLLERAGQEIAATGKFSAATENLLKQDWASDSAAF